MVETGTCTIMAEKVIIVPAGKVSDAVRKCFETVDFRPSSPEVILKPNAVSEFASGSGHVTDLRIVDSVIEILRTRYNTKKIFIMEGSSVFLKSSLDVLRFVGYQKLVEKHDNVELIDVYQTHHESGSAPFPLPALLKGRCLINLPVLKGHAQATLTCAVKNLKGLLPKTEKKRFHQAGLLEHLASLASIPTECTLVDATTCQSCEGDFFSKKVRLGLLVCSKNPVAADIVCSHLIGLNVKDISYLKTAADRMHLLDPGAVDVIGDDRARVHWTPFKRKLSFGKIDIFAAEACSGCIPGILSVLATPRFRKHVKIGILLQILRSYFKRKRIACIIGKNPPIPTDEHEKIILFGECACKAFSEIEGFRYRGCPPSEEIRQQRPEK